MGERTANVTDQDFAGVMQDLTAIINARKDADPDESYTARLLAGPADKLYGKLVEEALEVVLAAKDADHDHVRYEAADLLYHLLVVLKRQDISLGELAGELKARM